jgi:choline-sulfatase
LIIRYPERFDPGTVEQNVNLCDLYATLCDFAGVPAPEDRDSRNLVPLMEGGTVDWDNETISQGASNGAIAQGLDSKHLMTKRDDLKYCYYGDDGPEVLFDLGRDPGETTSYADDPDYADALDRFRKRRGELGYGSNSDPDYENAGYR